MNFFSKFPKRQESLPVFSLILFIVYSFTIYRMLFQIPSWLYSHSKTGILFLASYVFAVALIECVMLFGFILLINLILPGKLFHSRFTAQGSLAVVLCTIWAISLKYFFPRFEFDEMQEPFIWLFIFLISLLLFLVIASNLMDRYQRIQELVDTIADRMVIFGWVYAPIGLVSLALVLLRNIF